MTGPNWEPDIGDAFGAMLMDCWQRGGESWAAVELVERDDGLLNANDGARYVAGPKLHGRAVALSEVDPRRGDLLLKPMTTRTMNY